MISFMMIIFHEIAGTAPQRIFTKEDHLLQTVFLNRPDETLRVGIAESRQLQIVWETRQGGSE